jgi:hypothetical protein
LNGTRWLNVTAIALTPLYQELKLDLARILALPADRITIDSVRIGSLIVTYTVQRNASQFLSDNIVNLLVYSAEFSATSALYNNVTNQTARPEAISVLNTQTIVGSDTQGTSGCDQSCIIIVAVASVSSVVLISVVAVIVIRRRRQRARAERAKIGLEKGSTSADPQNGGVIVNPIRHEPFFSEKSLGVGKTIASDYDDDDAAGAYVVDVEEHGVLVGVSKYLSHQGKSEEVYGGDDDDENGHPIPAEGSAVPVEHVIVDIEDEELDGGGGSSLRADSREHDRGRPSTGIRAPDYYPFVHDDDDASTGSPFSQPRKSSALSDYETVTPRGQTRHSPTSSSASTFFLNSGEPRSAIRIPHPKGSSTPRQHHRPQSLHATVDADGSFLVRTAGDVDSPRAGHHFIPADAGGGEDTSRQHQHSTITGSSNNRPRTLTFVDTVEQTPSTPHQHHNVFVDDTDELEDDYEWVYEECPADALPVDNHTTAAAGAGFDQSPSPLLQPPRRGMHIMPPTAIRLPNPPLFWDWWDVVGWRMSESKQF